MTAFRFALTVTAALVTAGVPAQDAWATAENGEEIYNPSLDPAFKVWRSLSGRGEPDSFFLVAQRYEKGERVQANPITALQYYILAAEMDHKDAETAVERLNDSLSKADRAEARERAANWSPVTDEDMAAEETVEQPRNDRDRLLAAADGGDLERVKELLEKGVPVDVQDQHGWTPLMLAALQGHDKTVALLLGQGADIEAQDINGTTALMAAASSGWLAVIKRLMKAGADMDVEDNAGETAFYMAEQFEHRSVVNFLAKVNASPEVIREVQAFLISKGYRLGKPDGLWGPKTEKAVQSFQKKLGMAPDGRITKKFLTRIREQSESDEKTSKVKKAS